MHTMGSAARPLSLHRRLRSDPARFRTQHHCHRQPRVVHTQLQNTIVHVGHAHGLPTFTHRCRRVASGATGSSARAAVTAAFSPRRTQARKSGRRRRTKIMRGRWVVQSRSLDCPALEAPVPRVACQRDPRAWWLQIVIKSPFSGGESPRCLDASASHATDEPPIVMHTCDQGANQVGGPYPMPSRPLPWG